MSKIQGSCNCGRIKISIAAESFPKDCTLCHCKSCCASGGSMFSTIFHLAESKVDIEGRPKVYQEIAKSGNELRRHFCGDCGSPVLTMSDKAPGLANIPVGVFKKHGIEIPAPVAEFWSESRDKWEVPYVEAARVFDAQPTAHEISKRQEEEGH